MNTLSVLGEPLQLEFEVLDLSPADVDSLKVALASAQSYASRGLGYDSALEGLRLGLIKSANGRWVIRIEGQRPTAEPFVDLLLDITWASGATTRAMSVLLATPPGTSGPTTARDLPNVPAASAGLEAGISSSASATSPASPIGPDAVQTTLAAKSTAVSQAVPEPDRATQYAEKPATWAPSPSLTAIVAQPGDTAGELARRGRPAGIEQSQYLLALVQGNPAAFVEGNVNRLQAGATLKLPSAAQAQLTPAPEARQIISAQWQEFQALRQQAVANSAAKASDAPTKAGTQAQGQMESPRAAATARPADKLTLSKPGAQDSSQADQALLNERQAKDANSRLDELNRTVKELSQLQANTDSTNPATAVSSPAPTAGPKMDAAVLATGLVDQLAEHPGVLPVAGSLFTLVMAWLGLRFRRKAQIKTVELATSETALGKRLTPMGENAEPVFDLRPKSDVQTEDDRKLDLVLDLDLDDETGPANRGRAAKEVAKQ